MTEEKHQLSDQLQEQQNVLTETEEMRSRLAQKKSELEEILADLEARLDDEDERNQQLMQDKKKMQANVKVIFCKPYSAALKKALSAKSINLID